MTVLLTLFDVFLLAGLTARLSRLVTTDDIGVWWVQTPAGKWAVNRSTPERRHKAIQYVEGLECPYCVGFWIAVATTFSLWLAGGPGDAAELWRWAAAAFTLNYVVAHISSRLDAS
jgi:hypothetical protein